MPTWFVARINAVQAPVLFGHLDAPVKDMACHDVALAVVSVGPQQGRSALVDRDRRGRVDQLLANASNVERHEADAVRINAPEVRGNDRFAGTLRVACRNTRGNEQILRELGECGCRNDDRRTCRAHQASTGSLLGAPGADGAMAQSSSASPTSQP